MNLFTSNKSKLTLLSIGLLSLTVLSYQNCGNHQFKAVNPDEAISSSQSNNMSLEKDAGYTNKKVIAISFSGLKGSYSKMRLSTNPAMNDNENPWVDYAATTTFDLGDLWASDGSKDGEKKIYAELYEVNSEESVFLNATIGLDTVPPKLSAKNLLAKGLEGKIIKKGESVKIEWEGSDPASINGYTSGLGRTSLKVAHSKQADCSSQQAEVDQDWTGYSTSLNNFKWPAQTPIDAFYICVYLKDQANNSVTLLSQPMLSLWKVLAGDNNQGNGGSVTAGNVRFQYPESLAKDSKGNIYISDGYFNNIRKISSDGKITLVAGSGPSGNTANGAVAQITPLRSVAAMEVDSKDRLIVTLSGQGVYLLDEKSSGATWKQLISNSCSARASIQHLAAGDKIVYYNSCSADPSKAASVNLNYIYRVPLATLETSALTLAQLSSYRVAGGGRTSLSSQVFPADLTFTSTDPESDAKFSLDTPFALKAMDNGDIIYATSNQAGGNQLWGHDLTRYLILQPNNSYKVVSLGGVHIGRQIEVAPYIKDTKNLLAIFVGDGDGPLSVITYDPVLMKVLVKTTFAPQVDATSKILNKWMPSAIPLELDPTMPYGVKSLAFTASTLSQIHVAGGDLASVSRVFGRNQYDSSLTIATESMMPAPTGLAQDSFGNTFIFDRYNHMIRRIDRLGIISNFLGNQGNPTNLIFNNTPFSGVLFNGTRHPSEQVNLLITQEGGKEFLSMSDGAFYSGFRAFHRFDLDKEKATSILGLPSATSAYEDVRRWEMGGIAADSAGHFFMIRRWVYKNEAATVPADVTALITDVTSGVDVPMLGRAAIPSTETVSGTAANQTDFSRVDSVTVDTVAAAGSSIAQDVLLTSTVTKAGKVQLGFVKLGESPRIYRTFKVNKAISFVSMRVAVANNGQRYLIGTSGSTLYYAKFDASVYSAAAPALTFNSLCMPGTFLNGAKYISLSSDNNILISDVYSGRVLEYFISSENGEVVTIPSDDASCLAL